MEDKISENLALERSRFKKESRTFKNGKKNFVQN
jgi:hypothetical protein